MRYFFFKIKLSKIAVILLILPAVFITACDDMEDKDRKPNTVNEASVSGIYVLSEGLMNMNNSVLGYYDFETKTFNPDMFLSVNKRGLGDTANDMELYGSKLYVVVNVSSQIEILDAVSGKSLKQIPMFDNSGVARQPRYVDFVEGCAYVTSFDGSLARIDTASLKITGSIQCGRNPDGLCVSNGKIYVSNSGGLDFPNYDNTVSVVDIKTFKEIKRITVGTNPGKIKADSEGDIYVVSRGNYGSSPYKFQKISSKTDEVVKTFDDIQALNFTISNDTAYIYNYDFQTMNCWVKVFDCKKEEIVSDHFISDGTTITTPYGIDTNPVNGDVYLTDAKSYVTWGDVLCFDRNGKLKFRLQETGLNPNKVVFVKRKI
jgi:YVTN family beta-propeller protein